VGDLPQQCLQLCGALGAHLLGDLGLTGYDDGTETVGITVLTVTP
jgi:hypothetical protein